MSAMTNKKLTPKQRAFAEHYALHGGATEAYRHAYDAKGMSPASVKTEAQRLLNSPHVAPTVEELLNRVAEIADEKFAIDAERILQELAAVAFYNAEDFFDWGYDDDGVPYVRVKPSADLTRTQKTAVMSVQEQIAKTGDTLIGVQMGDKLGALKLLAQHLGMFKQVHEHGGKVGGPVMLVISPVEAKLLGPRREAGTRAKLGHVWPHMPRHSCGYHLANLTQVPDL
jgi:phage terminase small subunit